MAKDNTGDLNKERMKNTELLSSRIESISDILQRGSEGNPSGIDWANKTPSGTGRGNIIKPNLYYEAMREHEKDNNQVKSKSIEKENEEKPKSIKNEPEPDREK